MHTLKQIRRWTCALAVAALATMGAPAQAAPLDDRIPADALLYVGWAGTDTLKAQYNGSNLKSLLDATGVRDIMNKQLPNIMKEAGIRPDEEDEAIILLRKLLDAAWIHPVAIYVRPVDLSDPQEPVPRFGLICDAGADAKALEKAFTDALAKNPMPAQLKFRLALDGTCLNLSIGSTDTPTDLKKAGGLAAVAAYKSAMKMAKHATPALAVYADAAKGISHIKEAIEKVPDAPPQARERMPAVLEEFGLNNLTQFAYQAGFEGKEWGDHMFMGIKGERKGLLAAVSGTPLSDSLIAAVPKDAVAFSAWKMDLHKFLTETRRVVAKLEPNAGKEMENELAKTTKETGLDVEKDVLAPLGDEWVLYRAPPPEGGAPSFAMVHKLKDGAKFAKTLETLEKFANDAMKQTPVKIEKISVAKTQVSAIAFLQYSIAWTVKDNMLYIAPLDAIGGAIKQVANKSPSILENDAYKKARAGLPAEAKPLMLTYGNPARIYPQLRVLGLGLLPLIRSAGVDIPNTILPDPDDIAPFLPAGGGMIWSEADGIHGASRTAFPGASLLSGQQLGPVTVAMGGVAAGVMIPSLARARELSARSVSAANVRGVAQSCNVWAADNNDRMPDHLARLVASGQVAPQQLVSKRIGTAPLQMTPELHRLMTEDFPKFAAEVDKHCDYVYLGAGTRNRTDASIIVLYEKPGPTTTDGINIGFQDAHAEFIRFTWLPQEFANTNEELKKAGKPPVDVDALLKAANVTIPPELRQLP